MILLDIYKASNDSLKYILNLRNDHAKNFNYNQKITNEQHENWYQNYYKRRKYLFYIICNNSFEPIGTISVDLETKEIGNIVVDKEHRGNNYAMKAVHRIMDFFDLPEIYVQVRKDNEEAISYYIANDFKQVGENSIDDSVFGISAPGNNLIFKYTQNDK